MKLTCDKALEMLEKAEKDKSNKFWIKHSRCVGDTAGIIAKNLELDESKAKTLGYIHDIGKSIGGFEDHVINGYKYLKELGYDDEYANVCLTHSCLNNDVKCSACKVPDNLTFGVDFIENHEYTVYEKLITLCDLMCTSENLTLEERLKDVIGRRGTHEYTGYFVDEARKLKNEFDEMLGFDLYNIIPGLNNK